MSELKAQLFFMNSPSGLRKYETYLKSEADKVIAELKAQKAQAEEFGGR